MLCIYSIGSNNKPSAEEVEACSNTSSFSLNPQQFEMSTASTTEAARIHSKTIYTRNQIQYRLRRLVWFLSWCHRVKLEKKFAGKAFQRGEEKKKSNFDRAVRQSHLLPLQRIFHIVRSHHQSPRSSSQIDPCKSAMIVAHCVLAWLQQLLSSENGAPPTVGRTL